MTGKVMKDHVIGEDYATGFAMGLLVKDVEIANELGDAVNLHAPLSELVHKRWQEALDVKGFSADNSEAFPVWDQSKSDEFHDLANLEIFNQQV